MRGSNNALKLYIPVQQNLPQTFLKHLRWLMQKDKLAQDVFLIGPPGPLRRLLALSYSELTKRELEFITLTRDTTDTDLKQRREIRGGTSFYHDQVREEIRFHKVRSLFVPCNGPVCI